MADTLHSLGGMYAIPPVLIECPVSGNLIPTGLEADRLREASEPRVVLDCPDCGQDHQWDPTDAVFAAADAGRIRGTIARTPHQAAS